MRADEVYAILKGKLIKLTEDIKSMGDWKPIQHKGTVQTADDLPTDAKEGWMYNIATDSIYGAAGMNVVMTSEGWDPMGPIINMGPYLTKEEGNKTFQPKGNYLSGTDSDLKESGKAADAKVTGEKIAKNSSDITKKLDKNQGVENSGKIAGINESGDIVPIFPVGVEYNSETNCLEFGSDQKMKLNQGIGLDSTLTKTGFAADAGATGKEINSLKEDKADKTSLVKTDRKLDALWKLNQGISYEFQTDDTEAYQKTVPSGAKVANVKSIGGKTIVWNQMVQNGDFSLNSMWSAVGSTISVEGNTGIFTATEAALTNNKIEAYQILSGNVVKGHKYCVRFEYNLSVDINDQSVLNLGSVSTKIPVVGAGTWGKFNSIATVNVASNIFDLYFYFDSLSVGDTVKLRNVQLFDLTQMFGSGNEPSTPEEFEAMFPADYYPYNAGELMSAPVNEVRYLDTKSQETSYPIPQAILNLPGYGLSAGNVRNEVDWENKKYYKRVGKVDLGTLEYRYDPNTIRFIVGLADVLIKDKNDKFNCISTFYTAASGDIFDDSKETDLIIRVDENVNQIYIRNLSYADATTFKNAMSGVILYYELAEEQITDISNLIGDTLQEPIEVEAGGALTFKNSNGDNYRIPVSSTEEYLVSLAEVAK